MKTKKILFSISLAAGTALSTSAEKVDFTQLPVDLQQKIRAHTGAARINDIDRMVKDGRTIYEVGYKDARQGDQRELRFNEQGQLLNDDGTPRQGAAKLSWNELPEAVKATASKRVRQASVNDIDRRIKDGQTTYEIGFKNNGAQQELLLSEDGKILSDVQVPQELIAGLQERRSLSPTPVNLSAKTKVELKSLPERVQTVVAAEADGARIEDVERGSWNGRPVYEVAFKDSGRHVELQVAEDGAIVHDPRQSGVGRPAAGVTGSGKYSHVTSAVQLSSAQKVERSSLPEPVERAIVTHTGGARIEDIERGSWQNNPVFEVAFKDKGKHVELQLDEKGEVIFDPRKNNNQK